MEKEAENTGHGRKEAKRVGVRSPSRPFVKH
jgi:hypothetical protein